MDDELFVRPVPVSPAPMDKMQTFRRNAFLRANKIDPSAPMQLDIWPSNMRAIPNDLARSAIFTVRNKREPRRAMHQVEVFHLDKSIKITYTGMELRAEDDELVWQQIVDYGKHFPLGEPIRFNLHQLCLDLGWSINKRNYERARKCITYLKSNDVTIENPRYGQGIGISMISDYAFENGAEPNQFTRFKVWIHKELIFLFAGNNYTRLEWSIYRELTPIARRLYDYMASHREPYPLMLDRFRQMCGSESDQERSWSVIVRRACGLLNDSGLVKRIWVANERIYCER